jgi:phosphatidylinositol alpha 1,6-mannosyltransferase
VSDRVELGLGMLQSVDRPADSELRILIFTATYFVLDGVTLTIRRLENHLKSRGAIVKIVTTVPENTDPNLLKDVIIVPGIKIPFNHAGDYSFGVGLDEDTISMIEHFSPNVVHFTVPDFVALDGIRWCQRNNIAYIGTWHSNYCEYLKYYFVEWLLGPGFHRYLKGFFEQIPTVYAPTPYMLKKMRDEWGYGTATELKEWGRGVDMQTFSPERRSKSFRASKGISETDVCVLWVSRIVPEKRPDIWMSVVQRLQDEGLPVKSIVVGNGTFEKNLSKLKHVSCCGWLSGNALGEAYASSDILLFPSDVETFGNVTLESLSSGCPCVVEQKCGEHLVDNGVSGLTCPAGDFEAFYQATRKLVLDSRLRTQMGIAAREKAWQYERNIILQQMAENYKDAIVKHRDPAFLKRHLQSPEGAGRTMLSFFCCNYFLVKLLASPFLDSVRSVQDAVDNSQECVQTTRNRLSCTDFMSSAHLRNLADLPDEGDLEVGMLLLPSDISSDKEKGKKNAGRCCTGPVTAASNCLACMFAPFANTSTWRIMHVISILCAVAIVVTFIYATFTV